MPFPYLSTMKQFFRALGTAVLLSGAGVAQAQQSAPAEQVYVVVEQMPRFVSADSSTTALLKYLNSQLRYPVEALQAQAAGQVFVRFVVNKEGGVEQASVVKGNHKALDKEALRVVGEMPRWQVPGQQHGQPVSVALTVPITFRARMATPAEAQSIRSRPQGTGPR